MRTALRGGSPNEIGPLLRSWRESPEGKAALRSTGAGSPLPPEIADLCAEFWLRVSIAAQLAATDAVRSVESESTQAQLNGLRGQLQRELIKYGELTAQSARHEAGAPPGSSAGGVRGPRAAAAAGLRCRPGADR